MSSKKTVKIFYDVVSPFAWLGFEGICRYQQKWNINLHLRPFLLRDVFAATGNTPPSRVPAKGLNNKNEIIRMRTYMQVPLNFPSGIKGSIIESKDSQRAQRLLVAASLTVPDRLEDLSRALWLRLWSRDQDIVEEGSLMQACKAAGLEDVDGQSLVGRLEEPGVKEVLDGNTAEALDHGAFGAPTFLVEGVDGKKHIWFLGLTASQS